MSHLYRYIGDEPTVFISLEKNGETWVPNEGDEIEVDEVLTHPLLEEVVTEEEVTEEVIPEKKIAVKAIKPEPIVEAKSETEETPTPAEAVEEN